MVLTENGHKRIFWDNVNVLKLGRVGGCTTLYEFTCGLSGLRRRAVGLLLLSRSILVVALENRNFPW